MGNLCREVSSKNTDNIGHVRDSYHLLSIYYTLSTMLNTVLPRCHSTSMTHLRGNNNPTTPFPPPKTE